MGVPHNKDPPSPGQGEGGQGDAVDQLVDLRSIGWKLPLDRRLRSRMTTRPFQFTGMEEKIHPNLNGCLNRNRVDIQLARVMIGFRCNAEIC